MSYKQLLSSIGIFVAFIFSFNIALLGIRTAKNLYYNSVEIVDPTIPRIDPMDPKIKKVSLLEKSYTPPVSPFSEISYSLAPRIIYKGSFSEVRLEVEGGVTGDGERLLMLNVGETTGFIDAARRSSNVIDLLKSRTLGGVVSSENPIHKIIDLRKAVLSSSSQNFSSCGATCLYQLINDSVIASVKPILVIPVFLNGGYGGGVIDSLTITYKCLDESSECTITTCNTDETDYSCVKRNFSKQEADEWYKWFTKQ